MPKGCRIKFAFISSFGSLMLWLCRGCTDIAPLEESILKKNSSILSLDLISDSDDVLSTSKDIYCLYDDDE